MGLLDKLFGKQRSDDAGTPSLAQGMEVGWLALGIVVRWMMDGGDVQKMREFIRWLDFSDIILTEHVIILRVLKELEASGDELSIDALRAALPAVDYADFARDVLEQIVKSRRDGPADGPGVDRFFGVLVELRKEREEESKTAKRKAVKIARRILARKMGVIEGAGRLQSFERHFPPDEDYGFAILSRITCETRDHPLAGQRKYWAPDALARIDRERAELEEKTRPEVHLACRKLIERWAAV